MSTLRNAQWMFLQNLATLITFAAEMDGVELTGGGLWQDNQWHIKNSTDSEGPVFPHSRLGFHPTRTAIDMNLFVDGVWQQGFHHIWIALGTFWERLHPDNRWGGNFSNIKDYNHFERVV